MATLTVTGTGAAVPSSQSVYHVTTELEAVNLMLATIGEQPVNSLDISTISEVSIASSFIYEVSREMQTRGWAFNEDYDYKLYLADGEIPLPINTLKVKVTGPSSMAIADGGDYCVQRGQRLYNRTDSTFTFTETYAETTIVWFLPFTELPQTARNYITMRAARKFQMRLLGSKELEGFTQIEEQQAWLALMAEEVDSREWNMSDYRMRRNRNLS